jgi:putative ABC transport system permease protein
MMAVLWLLAALALPPAQEPGPPGMLIERRLAEEAGLGVGDTVRVRALAGAPDARAFRVDGVFERAADPNRISRNEYEVRFHLPDLEAMLPTRDRVDRFAVALAPGSSPDSVGRWIEGLAYGTRAYGSAALADESSTTFLVISRFHRAIGVVTVLASGIFLLCVMIIRVDERRRDVGVLRLIGISRWTVFRAVVLEALGIAALGSVAGAVLGILIAQGVNAYYASVYDTTLKFALLTPRILLVAGLLGLALGVVAGTLAALRVATVSPERLGER